MKKILLAAVFVTCFGLFAPSVFAWDDVGHKITAYIAWQRMSPEARENAIRIMRSAPEDAQLSTFYMNYGAQPENTRKREFFMLSATWPDIVRDRSFPVRFKTYHKSNWHYDDTFWRQVNGKVETIENMPEGGQGVPKLEEFDRLLRDAKAPDAQKALAIAWMLHIGGDLHQPLHTSARVTETEPKGDQGGNLFLLSPEGTARAEQVNLHWFWDSIVGRNVPIKGEQCDRDYIEPIAQRIMRRHPFASMSGGLHLGDYRAWQKESFEFNPTDVFSSDLDRFEMPSSKYRKNAFRVAERQLAAAGYRLGETLNNILSPKGSSAQ